MFNPPGHADFDTKYAFACRILSLLIQLDSPSLCNGMCDALLCSFQASINGRSISGKPGYILSLKARLTGVLGITYSVKVIALKIRQLRGLGSGLVSLPANASMSLGVLEWFSPSFRSSCSVCRALETSGDTPWACRCMQACSALAKVCKHNGLQSVSSAAFLTAQSRSNGAASALSSSAKQTMLQHWPQALSAQPSGFRLQKLN